MLALYSCALTLAVQYCSHLTYARILALSLLRFDSCALLLALSLTALTLAVRSHTHSDAALLAATTGTVFVPHL